MARRKKKEDFGIAKPAMSLVGGATILGVGGAVVTGVGGPTAGAAGGGLTAAASFLPPIGAAIGAGLTVQQLKKLQKTAKRKR